jgi:hypothetical protein
MIGTIPAMTAVHDEICPVVDVELMITAMLSALLACSG